MKPSAPIVFALLAASTSAFPVNAEESIYRCASGATVTFQWTSCATDQQERIVASSTAPQLTRASWRMQVRSPAPYIGISDDAVLNMRGWGRPAKIVRQRGERSWLEHWLYVSPGGEARHLHFSNGRLVAINIEPAPYVVQLANATGPEPGQRSRQ